MPRRCIASKAVRAHVVEDRRPSSSVIRTLRSRGLRPIGEGADVVREDAEGGLRLA